MEAEVRSINWAPFLVDFPNTFRDAELSEMGVGEGWTELLWDLCKSMEPIVVQGDEDGTPFRILQVKEKFGGLRFYAKGTSIEVWTLIQEACAKSEGICEACGALGSHCTIDGWIKTLCAACQTRLGERSSHGGGWGPATAE